MRSPTMMFETPMGAMTVIEILVEDDRPLLFSCQSATGQTYVAHFIDASGAADRWFLVPVSPARLSAIRTGDISLRASIQEPEHGWFWDLTVFDDDRPGTAVTREARSLNERELPGPNARLHLKSQRSTRSLPLVHVYGQPAWHDDVWIVGTTTGLTALRDALQMALVQGHGATEVLTGDGEGYGIQIRRDNRADDDPGWVHRALPYYADVAADSRPHAVWPDTEFASTASTDVKGPVERRGDFSDAL